jgi:PAS domain-containing protein
MEVLQYSEDCDDVLDSATLAAKFPLTDTLEVTAKPRKAYGEGQIRAALYDVGKYDIKDELNCSTCGYDTCRDFAAAMLDGRAEKTMCVTYMRNLAQKKANALIRAIPSGVVMVDKDLQIVDSNRVFARLMGAETVEMFEVIPGLEGANLEKITESANLFREVLSATGKAAAEGLEQDVREDGKILHLTVFAVEKGEIVAGVYEDVTAPQSRKDRTVSRAQKIIDKNVAAVQKIAFLLGENAAETEAILQSIIASYAGGEVQK